MTPLTVLVLLALLATSAALLLGIVTMGQGGRFDQHFGTRMMWARVGMQALAIALLVVVFFMSR